MEESLQAFFLFWLAGLAIIVGLMLGFFSKQSPIRRFGMVLLTVGTLSILATPWTLSFSPSSAFGHFLGSILGPSVLLGVGLYNIAFSGHVPVGRLSESDKRAGFVMVLIAMLWFEGMHWWVLTPTYPDEINRYWLIFWPTLLLVTASASFVVYYIVKTVGDERYQEQRLLLTLFAFTSLLIILGLLRDGPHVESNHFAEEFWLAGADVFGLMVGAALAILLFALVLSIYEAQQPLPKQLDPPTSQQLEKAAKHIAKHVGGVNEDE
ncbi:MAG: hypothetical protein ACPH2L_02700 [Poseidonia sp.]